MEPKIVKFRLFGHPFRLLNGSLEFNWIENLVKVPRRDISRFSLLTGRAFELENILSSQGGFIFFKFLFLWHSSLFGQRRCYFIFIQERNLNTTYHAFSLYSPSIPGCTLLGVGLKYADLLHPKGRAFVWRHCCWSRVGAKRFIDPHI